MAARETAARLEGELTAMRVVEGELALRARPATSTVAAVPLRWPWWRRPVDAEAAVPRVNLCQPAACDEDAIGVDHGQLMPRRKGDDEFAVNQRRPTHHHDQAAIRRARECRDGAFDLASVGQSNRLQLDVQRVCHGSLPRRGDGRALTRPARGTVSKPYA